MKFVTLFLPTENIHLTKDVGMIPYMMYKKYNYDSGIACYNNGDYPHLSKEVSGLKLEWVTKKTGKMVVDGSLYILKNARKIDVLNVFHLEIKTLLWIMLYKILHPAGKVYLKLDAENEIKKMKFKRFNLKHIFKLWSLKKCNLISVETKEIANFINQNWPVKVVYIPNGFYDYGKKEEIKFEGKKNKICHVARIGTKQKATNVLLEGFRKASKNLPDWQLEMVGPIESDFLPIIEKFSKDFPDIAKKINYHGAVYDKERLNHFYSESKIFGMSSLHESFGIVFVEALKNGCTILTSAIDSADDLTDNQRLGKIYPISDSDALAQNLEELANNQEYLKKNCKATQEFAYKEFYWPKLIEKIQSYLV